MRLFHNIEQNKRIKFADDVADVIVESGFTADLDDAVWLSSQPLGDGAGTFTGLAIAVPDGVSLEAYRQEGDGIELYLGVEVYALPADVANSFPRERWYPREGELVE